MHVFTMYLRYEPRASVNSPVAAVTHDKTTGFSLAESEWSIGQTKRIFRISVICGLNYSVNNTICSGLSRSATGCASNEAGEITR